MTERVYSPIRGLISDRGDAEALKEEGRTVRVFTGASSASKSIFAAGLSSPRRLPNLPTLAETVEEREGGGEMESREGMRNGEPERLLPVGPKLLEREEIQL